MARRGSPAAGRKPTRIYLLAEAPLEPGALVPLSTRQYRHLISVLRRGAGDLVDWFAPTAQTGAGVLEGSDRTGFGVRIGSVAAFEPIPPETLVLLLGTPKMEHIADCLELATIAGVTAIRLFAASRTAFRLTPKKFEALRPKWEARLGDAAEQCNRVTVPTLIFGTLRAHLAALAGTPLRVAVSPEEAPDVSQGTRPELAAPGVQMTIAIGPEGGLVPEELKELRQAGAVPWQLPGVTFTSVAACGILPALWRWDPRRTYDFPATSRW